jgi:hypothetical protein
VKEALLGTDSVSGRRVFTVQPNPNQHNLEIPTGGAAPDVVMAYGFGRSDGVDPSSKGFFTEARGEINLVLTQDAINNRKGVWFLHITPTINKESALADRRIIRDCVGVFDYLGFTGGSEPIWEKWMRVSNWIDLVCFVFGQQYPWNPTPLLLRA